MQESVISNKHLKILELLKRAGGSYVSGETISRKIRISRAAIWKYVSALRRYGYRIVSKQGSGYKLVKVSSQLLPWEIKDGLGTEFVGKEMRHFAVIDSTQDVAVRLAESGAPEGVVVIAGKQRKGRGRIGRRWIAPEGGIWLSVILKPKVPPAESTIMPLLGALAVSNAIRKECRLDARLKWPNDVVINGKKVSGILAEMSCEADRINYIVIGIGINANVNSRKVQKMVKGTKGYYGATSLMDEVGMQADLVRLTRRILAEMEWLYIELEEQDSGTIIEAWKEHSATLGTTVTVAQNGTSFVGSAVDLDYDGALLVKLPDGDVRRVIAGDVYVRSTGQKKKKKPKKKSRSKSKQKKIKQKQKA